MAHRDYMWDMASLDIPLDTRSQGNKVDTASVDIPVDTWSLDNTGDTASGDIRRDMEPLGSRWDTPWLDNQWDMVSPGNRVDTASPDIPQDMVPQGNKEGRASGDTLGDSKSRDNMVDKGRKEGRTGRDLWERSPQARDIQVGSQPQGNRWDRWLASSSSSCVGRREGLQGPPRRETKKRRPLWKALDPGKS